MKPLSHPVMKLSTFSFLALVAAAGPLNGATLLTNVAPRGAIVDVSATYSAAERPRPLIDCWLPVTAQPR